MIKYSFMTISLILLAFVFCGNDHTNEFVPAAIKCNHTITKSYNNDTLTGYFTYSYDEKGNMVSDTFFGPDRSIRKIFYFFYDNKDSVSRSEERDPGGELLSYRNYSLDEKGHMLEKTIWTRDSSLRIREQYIYDEKGREIEERRFDLSGKLTSKSTFEVSGSGIYLSFKSYDSTGNLISMTLFVTDAKGNRTESRYVNPDSSLNVYTLYRYNSEGRKIEEKSFKSDSSFLSWTKYEYNHSGKIIRANTLNKDGITTTLVESNYDLNNNLLEMIGWNNGTLFSRTTYEYDCHYK